MATETHLISHSQSDERSRTAGSRLAGHSCHIAMWACDQGYVALERAYCASACRSSGLPLVALCLSVCHCIADCSSLKSAALRVQSQHLDGAFALSWTSSLTALDLNIDVSVDGALDVAMFPSGLISLVLFFSSHQRVVLLLGSFRSRSSLRDLCVSSYLF
jgi:hypothetical protein